VVRRKEASPALERYLTGTLNARVALGDSERDVYVVGR
jgi:hypothetical protein